VPAAGKEIAAGFQRFERLGAAQLIKHALGLTRRLGPGGFCLVYLWYEVPGRDADQHLTELAGFAERQIWDEDMPNLVSLRYVEGDPGEVGIARLAPLEIEGGKERPRDVSTGPHVSQALLGKCRGPRGVIARAVNRSGCFCNGQRTR